MTSNILTSIINKCAVVDLFCGIGGLTHGIIKTGLQVVAGFDIDGTCKYSYESNNNSLFFEQNVRELSGEKVLKLYNNKPVKILVGCAPCQPFSSYTQKGDVNEKWTLLYEFERLIRETKPEIVSMENVAKLLNFSKSNVFADFVTSLKSMGYNLDYKIINCADYGVPQLRKRLVLLASKLGNISIIPPTHSFHSHITVRQAISHLPALSHGESDPHDFIHRANGLNKINFQRIIASREGGSWKDWDDSLKLKCHLKPSGKTYTSVYGRMFWDKPSPTITTHCIGIGNGRFGHPEQDRAISLREAAILQGFPETYKFYENKKNLKVRELAIHLGNAVPVQVGEIIGKSILQHLNTNNEVSK